MTTKPCTGDVWLADLGYTAKIRPVLVLAAPGESDARALLIVAPLTSQLRGMRGEVALGKIRWLPKPSAVNVQGLASINGRILQRRLGTLTRERMEEVKQALRDLLEL